MTYGPISELQISLIVLGLVAVAGVWGYNVWQERKQRKLAQEVFRGEQRDVLIRHAGTPAATAAGGDLAAARIEPVFIPPEGEIAQAEQGEIPEPLVQSHQHDDQPQQAAQDDDYAAAHVEPHAERLLVGAEPDVADDVAREAAHAEAKAHEEAAPALDAAQDSEPPPELADDIIDCIVHLNAAELVSAPLFWAAQRQLMSRLARRLCWSGLDENTGHWRRLHANDANSYRRLVAALQLADRNGPVGADDLALYCDGVRQLAAHYQAQVIVPVVADVLIRAQSLDEFCAAVDWRLGINLVHRDGMGLPLAAIWQLAEAAGLQRLAHADDGMLHAVDERGQTLFTLGLLGAMPFANEDAMQTASGVTLTIDVPRVSDGSAAFHRMLGLARHIVTALDAVLVDDQRMPLSEDILTMIGIKIGEFQQKMAAHQLPAGGRRALRLYS